MSSKRQKDYDWVLRARELLDADSERIDAATRARLTRARHAALAQSSRPRRPTRARGLRLLAAAAMLAGIALLARQLLLPVDGRPQPAIEPAMVAVEPLAPEQRVVATADFALIAEADNYALLEELEFYSWLAEAPAADGDGQDG